MEPGDARRELLRLWDSTDNTDSMLVHLLAERSRTTQQMGRLKVAAGLPPADPDREAQQTQRLHALAVESELDLELAEKFVTLTVREVVRHHGQVAAEEADEGWIGFRVGKNPGNARLYNTQRLLRSFGGGFRV